MIKLIKNYIFDFGNVLAEFYPDRLTAPFVQDKESAKLISGVVFDRIYWDKLDAGTITDGEVKADIVKRLPKNLGSIACKVYDNWINTMTPVPGMQELVDDIKKTGKKLYLLSNISVGFANSYFKVKWIKELLDLFDGLVLSATVGKTKPSSDIFEHLLEAYNLDAGECLFVDDSEKNVKGAEMVGISAYLFDGDSEKLRKFINM